MANHIANTSIELENNSNDDNSSLKYQIAQLLKENEDYKQTIHCLQSKIQVDLEVRNELQETIDNLDESMQQLKNQMQKKINDIEEKNGTTRMELLSKLSEMENKLEEKIQENQKLQYKLMEANKLLLVRTEKQVIDLSIKDETILSNSQEELMEKLLQEENARKLLEHTVDAMSKEECELKTILQITKEQLIEKNEILKITQDELQECRIELETLKNVPADVTRKGNSLFAEVEDRRKKLLDQMTNMRTAYYDAKSSLASKDDEIKALRMELAVLLDKQNDEVDYCIQENGELLDKHKDRILDLENELSEQQKKYRKLEMQKRPTDISISYFQSLLETKSKEIEKLEKKFENLSRQSLKLEEMILITNRQMRYWRNKAMSYQARIETIKFQLQNNSSFDNDKLSKIFQLDCTMKTSLNEVASMDLAEELPPIIDETVITIDELINIPKLPKHTIHVQDEKRGNSHSLILPIDNAMLGSSDSSDKLNDIQQWQDNKTIENKQSKRMECDVKNEDEACTLIKSSKNMGIGFEEKGKKTLRFSAKTVDPEPRKLQRKNTPKYPIIHITNNPSNK